MSRKKFKLVKFMIESFQNASRNKRELSLLVEEGFDCMVICGEQEASDEMSQAGYRIKALKKPDSARQNWSPAKKLFARLSYLMRVRKALIAEQADICSCHDLLAMFIAWTTTWFVSNRKKTKLVYDAHEFELGRAAEKKRSGFIHKIIFCMEKFLIKKAAFTIMVNDTISRETRKIYKLTNEKIIVVRSTPFYWELDEKTIKENRERISREYGFSADDFIVMYHGMVSPIRGIDKLIDVANVDKDIRLMILGPGDEGYIKALINTALHGNAFFHPAVAMEDLWKYIGIADVGLIVIPSISQSYYYMLPNKLFENIQAEVPLIVNDFPELRNIVEQYNIGLIVPPDAPAELIHAVNTMKTDKQLYKLFKENLKKAKAELCWEHEKIRLKEAYLELRSTMEAER